jgi:hypothetical protein
MKTYVVPTIHSYGTLSTTVQTFGNRILDLFSRGSLKITT